MARRPRSAASAMLIAATIAGCARGSSGPGRDAGLSPASAESKVSNGDGPASDGAAVNGESLAGTGPRIRLSAATDSTRKRTIDVVGLDAAVARALTDAPLNADEWPKVFAVYVEPAGEPQDRRDVPPMLGSYRISGETLQFEPRFPLEPGVRYRAVFDLTHAPESLRVRFAEPTTGGGEPRRPLPITAEFVIPRPAASATTTVTHVYPTRDKLPENQLKFYIHFSAPMGRGGAYQHIHLLDSSGNAIDLPFLELDEELWDPSGTRFTLLFDPGRIKRGLKPREEVGPTLVKGLSYTLVIDRDWRDAADNPLVDSVRKQFDVGPPDEQQPDPNTWTITVPTARTAGPLVITFPEPLDHAMLERVITVTDTADRPIPGQVSVERGETRWRFVPGRAWIAGTHRLVIDTSIEDLAGNSIARPFEVDATRVIERAPKADTFVISFEIKPAPRSK